MDGAELRILRDCQEFRMQAGLMTDQAIAFAKSSQHRIVSGDGVTIGA